MAACRSLPHIFDKPLPSENHPMLNSLPSWNPIKTNSKSSPIDETPSFADIFNELHFQDNIDTTASSPINLSPATSFPPPSFLTEITTSRIQKTNNNTKSESNYFTTKQTMDNHHHHSNSFSSINSDSLSICTEGLGSESSDEVEVEDNTENNWVQEKGRSSFSTCKTLGYPLCTLKRSRTCGSNTNFPPPISSIGSSGKPWVCFKSYRHNGRFVLKEVRVPNQEFLLASREDGRLKLQFIQSDDDIGEDDGEEEQEDDEDDNGGRGINEKEYDTDRNHDKDEYGVNEK